MSAPGTPQSLCVLCPDVNECGQQNGGCNQICFNKPGSFHCACYSGYALSPDGRTCRGNARATSPSLPPCAPRPPLLPLLFVRLPSCQSQPNGQIAEVGSPVCSSERGSGGAGRGWRAACRAHVRACQRPRELPQHPAQDDSPGSEDRPAQLRRPPLLPQEGEAAACLRVTGAQDGAPEAQTGAGVGAEPSSDPGGTPVHARPACFPSAPTPASLRQRPAVH